MPLFAEMDYPTIVRTVAKLDIEHLLLQVLVQLIVIIAAARLFGLLARLVRQPTTVGEIIAGLLLGPTVFGRLFPEYSAAIFQPDLHPVPTELAKALFPKIFQVLAQIGLIFLLFLIGLEFEFTHLKARGRAALAVSVTGVVFPFALGVGLGLVLHPELTVPIPKLGFVLFMGVAMSITAIPILGRIMIELGINRTTIGAVVITAAAIDDAIGWTLLATVAALAKFGTEQYDPAETIKMLGLTVAFVVGMLVVVRPLLIRYYRTALGSGGLSLNGFTVLLVTLFTCAIATNLIGIFAIFGAFLLGAVMSDQKRFREVVTDRLRDFVTAFFLPIFFTYTGLRTDIRMEGGWHTFLVCLAVLTAAVVGKFGGCAIAAWCSGFRPREAAIIGVMMNTRALMELIVINVGYELGVIPKDLFWMLVVMAVVTTIMTTPVLLALRRGTELEEPIARSGFLGGTGR